jgi:hypothetical protein
MPAEPDPFRVLTTPGYERDFRTISRGRPAVADAMEACLLFCLAIHTTVAGGTRSKNSADTKRARGNGEFAGKNTACGMTFSEAMWSYTRSGIGRKPTGRE